MDPVTTVVDSPLAALPGFLGVIALLLINLGLDEIANPRLRKAN